MRLTEQDRLLAVRTLNVLVGQPLTDMWRYAGCQKFEFGEQKPHLNDHGEETSWADWGLVVSCGWRILGPEGFLLSRDLYEQSSEPLDAHADSFYECLEVDSPVVESVVIGDDGGLRFEMTGGYTLVLDVGPLTEADFEEWRLMPPDDPRGHFVLAEDLSWSSG